MDCQKIKSLPEFPETVFREKLLAWYDAHARDLPWRTSRDPYRVWVSEIMLQQTRVAAVIGHYHEFLRRFPTVEKLASARESSVLAAWSGLGYYRRARMLHAAAKAVVREHGGKFPRKAAGWRALPGVGRYTAAAVASIAFGEAVAVVDGNVERVLQRLSGKTLSNQQLWERAETLLERKRPGDFNQAMMELGATVCTPRAPACPACPMIELCAIRGEQLLNATTAPQKKRVIHYALDHRNSAGREKAVFLVKRSSDARLMAGMWELPEMDGPVPRAGKKQIPPLRFASARNDKREKATTGNPTQTERTGTRLNGKAITPLFTLRHSITVTDYTVQVWRRAVSDRRVGEWIPATRLPKLALTGLARKILRKVELLAR
jgi:A/G-specific adenine glycosylase